MTRSTQSRAASAAVAGLLAVAAVVLLAQPAAAAAVHPVSASATAADATTVKLTGSLRVTVIDGSRTSETAYSVEDAAGRFVEVTPDFDDAPVPGSTFRGELVVPPSTVRAVEADGVKVDDREALSSTTASGAAVLDELDQSATPATVASAT
ncbi:MAG: hypothetical protein JWP31_2149, partial [Aeromicrobium sp.]|nr:hypothetical protein [Aeromicrobium sp.]